MWLWENFLKLLERFKRSRYIRDHKRLYGPEFRNLSKIYNGVLDEFILTAIEQDTVEYIDEHYCKIGESKIWIANYPYASAVIGDFRPSRATIKELNDHILKKKLYKGIQMNSIRFITGKNF